MFTACRGLFHKLFLTVVLTTGVVTVRPGLSIAKRAPDAYSVSHLWLWTLGQLGRDDVTLGDDPVTKGSRFLHQVYDAARTPLWTIEVDPGKRTVTLSPTQRFRGRTHSAHSGVLATATWDDVFGATEKKDQAALTDRMSSKITTLNRLVEEATNLEKRKNRGRISKKAYLAGQSRILKRADAWLDRRLNEKSTKAARALLRNGSGQSEISQRLVARFGKTEAGAMMTGLAALTKLFYTEPAENKLTDFLQDARAIEQGMAQGVIAADDYRIRRNRLKSALAHWLGGYLASHLGAAGKTLAHDFIYEGRRRDEIVRTLGRHLKDQKANATVKVLDALVPLLPQKTDVLKGYVQTLESLDGRSLENGRPVIISAVQRWIKTVVGGAEGKELARDFIHGGMRKEELRNQLTLRVGDAETRRIMETLEKFSSVASIKNDFLGGFLDTLELLEKDRKEGRIDEESHRLKKHTIKSGISRWMGRQLGGPQSESIAHDFIYLGTREKQLQSALIKHFDQVTAAKTMAALAKAKAITVSRPDDPFASYLVAAQAVEHSRPSASDWKEITNRRGSIKALVYKRLTALLGGDDQAELAHDLIYKRKNRARVLDRLTQQSDKRTAKQWLDSLDEVLKVLPTRAPPFQRFAKEATTLVTARQKGLANRVDDTRARHELKGRVLHAVAATMGGDIDAKEIARAFLYQGKERDRMVTMLTANLGEENATVTTTALDEIRRAFTFLDRRPLRNQGPRAFPFAFEYDQLLGNFIPNGFIPIDLNDREKRSVAETLKEATSTGMRPDILSVFVDKGSKSRPKKRRDIYVAFTEKSGHKLGGLVRLSDRNIEALRIFNPNKRSSKKR